MATPPHLNISTMSAFFDNYSDAGSHVELSSINNNPSAYVFSDINYKIAEIPNLTRYDYAMFPLTGINVDINNLEVDISAYNIVTDVSAVIGSLHNIINTRVGERVMEPTFGINLNSYVFELMTPEMLASVQASINRAFNTWDTRFRCKKLTIAKSDNELVLNADIGIDGIPNTLPIIIRTK